MRDYGTSGQLGLEATPAAYVAALVAVFSEVRRVLAAAGTVWLNLGDSYASGEVGRRDAPAKNLLLHTTQEPRAKRRITQRTGLKPKDLVGIPWRVACALQADGWYLRSDIIWSKPNPMPESVTDRPTKSHEYVFLLAKSPRYWFDGDAVRERNSPTSHGSPRVNPGVKADAGGFTTNGHGASSLGLWTPETSNGRNLRSVWEIATTPYPDAHFATFPQELVRRCILAGCPTGGVVLDPFAGSGTTGLVARKHGRRAVLIELNESYCAMAARRLQQLSLLAEIPA